MDKLLERKIHWQGDDYIIWDYDYNSLWLRLQLVKESIWKTELIRGDDLIRVQVDFDDFTTPLEREEKHIEDLCLEALEHIDKIGGMIKD